MCGGPWQSPSGWNGVVPDRLPRPANQEWIGRLREVLAIERQSLVQYNADQSRFRTPRPYMMVIPQEENHIYWIERLFSAYGIASDGEVPQVKRSATLEEAYRTAIEIEAKSIPHYEWLIARAEDQTSRQALDTILLETRMHHTMFTHALRMGGMGMRR
jgi:hypothetical protein